MRILNPNLETQIIKYNIRKYSTNEQYDVILRNESSGVSNEFIVSYPTSFFLNDKNRLSITISSLVVSLNENYNFDLTVKDNSNKEVLFKGKLFTTSQDPQNYNING